jgi:crotonobetainyl-CoA:carnitine CoA-transferase CaiB-like acyl-CoA transferase
MAGLTYMTGPRPAPARRLVGERHHGRHVRRDRVLAALQQRNRTGKGQEIKRVV